MDTLVDCFCCRTESIENSFTMNMCFNVYYCSMKERKKVTTLEIQLLEITTISTLLIHFYFQSNTTARRWFSLLHLNIFFGEWKFSKGLSLSGSFFFFPLNTLSPQFPPHRNMWHITKTSPSSCGMVSLPPGAWGTLAGCLVLPGSRQSSFFSLQVSQTPSTPQLPEPPSLLPPPNYQT